MYCFCVFIVISAPAHFPVEDVAAVVIADEQMDVLGIILLDLNQFLKWSKDPVFMQLVAPVWVKIISETYDVNAVVNCFFQCLAMKAPAVYVRQDKKSWFDHDFLGYFRR